MNKQILFLALLIVIFTPSIRAAESTEAAELAEVEKKTQKEDNALISTATVKDGELEVDLLIIPGRPALLAALKTNYKDDHDKIANCFAKENLLDGDRCLQVKFADSAGRYLNNGLYVKGFPNPQWTLPAYIPPRLIPNEGGALAFICPIVASETDEHIAAACLNEKLSTILIDVPKPLRWIISEYGCAFDESVLIKATARNLAHKYLYAKYGKTEDAIKKIMEEWGINEQ